MRPLFAILCLLACFSVFTAPLGHLHAHVDDAHEHAHVHGGHVHEGEDHHGVIEEDQVIYLNAESFQQALKNFALIVLLPLCIVALVLLLPLSDSRLPRTPRKTVRVPSQFPPWPPPLRGPPLSA